MEGLRVKVQDSGLVGWEYNLHWPEGLSAVWALLLRNLFDEGASEAVHHSMLRVAGTPVAVDLVAIEHCPVLLEPVGVCL